MNFEVAPEFEKSLKRLSKKYRTNLKNNTCQVAAKCASCTILNEFNFINCE